MRPSQPSRSFATPARRAAFIAAMHALADQQRSGPPVVYLSASQRHQTAPQWPQSLERLTAVLPTGVWLDTFKEAFPGGSLQYRDHWQNYAADLDGLVVFGEHTATHTYLLGSTARTEVRTVINHGRPVLVFTDAHGLIPIVDCKAERIDHTTKHPSLQLTIPHSWPPSAPTLHAALQTLSPTTSRRADGAPHTKTLR